VLSIRDPVHGFIRADALETALINSRPVQRLRFIHQLGFTFLVFPGAEHSRFSHVVGAMHLAGRLYDALCSKADGLLPGGPRSPERRMVRAAALLHDVGHAPFSHSAEELFEGGIDHEEMTRRLLATPEIEAIFDRHGDGIGPEDVACLLRKEGGPTERLLSQVISGELDVDKMDYLLRDSLYCGVRYGTYDLERLLDTVMPLADPSPGSSGEWGIGVEEGGVHALEALVMARYYMFTQVYFNVTGKALELHLNQWMKETGALWSSDPEVFLLQDDISTWSAMRASGSLHARAVVERVHFPVAFETREHLTREEKERFEALLPGLVERFGAGNLLLSNSAKDPHRMGRSPVLVRLWDGSLEPMERASQFIRHLSRIDRYRVYTPPPLRDPAASALHELWAVPGN
jgi:uncharacterized protein